MLSVSIVLHATFSLVGYCFVNGRVRRNLYLSLLKCIGKKAPLLDVSMVNGSSSQNVNSGLPRSGIAYSSTYRGTDANSKRVHVGVSTSSETSRSTNKTSSSPYRSDTQLRNTSTSTSNYNSDRGAYMSKRSNHPTRHSKRHETKPEREPQRRDSESDSDASPQDGRGRTLDLISSHSTSDEEEAARALKSTGNSKSHKNMGVTTQKDHSPLSHTYMPNISDTSPDALNVLHCSTTDLFPNIKPMYAPRWSSQLPEAYLPSTNIDARGSQWSGGTMSDNEMASVKTASPNPLSYTELNFSPSKLLPDENYSAEEEKFRIAEKYVLYPYTAEELQQQQQGIHEPLSPTPYMLSTPSRILNSSLSHHSQTSNHDNFNNGFDRYGSLKRGQMYKMNPDNISYTDRYGSLKRGSSLHGSYHDNLNSGLERYGSLKRGKITPTMLDDTTDYIMPISSRTLSGSLSHDLQQHSNELAALRQLQLQQQQLQYEHTIAETEKDISNAETSV